MIWYMITYVSGFWVVMNYFHTEIQIIFCPIEEISYFFFHCVHPQLWLLVQKPQLRVSINVIYAWLWKTVLMMQRGIFQQATYYSFDSESPLTFSTVLSICQYNRLVCFKIQQMIYKETIFIKSFNQNNNGPAPIGVATCWVWWLGGWLVKLKPWL